MTSPISNAKFSPTTATDTQRAAKREQQDAPVRPQAEAPPRAEAAQTAPRLTPDRGLSSLDDVRALLTQTRDLLAAAPQAGLTAHGGVDAATANGRLHAIS